MIVPDRVTVKWISQRSDEELKELSDQFVFRTCRHNMVMKEIDHRQRQTSDAYVAKRLCELIGCSGMSPRCRERAQECEIIRKIGR